MLIFRDALAAVAPVLERAHMHSDDLRAYDDWDEIAQALFDNIVVRSIRWSDEVGADVNLGRYATLGQEHAQAAQVVVQDGSAHEWKSFHSFASRERPFDTVEALAADSVTTTDIRIDNVHFALNLPGRNGIIESLTIRL
jgi:hypothetical protein